MNPNAVRFPTASKPASRGDESALLVTNGRSLTESLPEENTVAVGFTDALADRQTESVAVGSPSAGFVGAVKPLEQQRLVCHQNAASGFGRQSRGS
jgi:hypothetical protein